MAVMGGGGAGEGKFFVERGGSQELGGGDGFIIGESEIFKVSLHS